ncbi:MAG: DUF5924 family protein, partial [Panacagrimonas sp.]
MKSRVAPLPGLEPTPRGSYRKNAERRAPTLEPVVSVDPLVPRQKPWVEPPAAESPIGERREPVLLPPNEEPAADAGHPQELRSAIMPSDMPDSVPIVAHEDDSEPEGPLFRPGDGDDAPVAAVSDDDLSLAAEDTLVMLEVPAESIAYPDVDLGRLLPTTVGSSRADAALRAANRFLHRLPWLLPTASFSIGWISFFLFQRGEGVARGIALIALLGWPWLLAENLLGRWVVARSKGRLSIGAVRF